MPFFFIFCRGFPGAKTSVTGDLDRDSRRFYICIRAADKQYLESSSNLNCPSRLTTITMSSNNDGPQIALSSSDHGAIVVITVVTAVVWTVLAICIRLSWRLHLKGSLGLDDMMVLLGTACTTRVSCNPYTHAKDYVRLSALPKPAPLS